MARVVVIGAHGKVALLAAPLLREAGHEVTGVIRNPAHAADVEASGATPLVADVETLDTDGLREVLDGHDVVVWSAGAGGGDPARTYAVDRDAAVRTVDASGAAGVQHFVMVSYFGAGPDHGVPEGDSFFAYADAKTAADVHLAASGLDWTILRPSRLTDDPATGRIEAGPDARPGSVPRADVGRVIAAVVDHPDTTAGRVIAFNGGATPVDEVVAAG
ncbi:SDR family oxidoreductase [Intrasporangium flavum]|uniref:SDR family oxidoreductase n=1 Tax=Intrasporangium flavum TaxID=1428657 RepID=UPI00096E2B59|nr:SDR family oxidoreductase [Intrasporangium flavum]